MVATRLRELKQSRMRVWDTEAKESRELDWRHMTILMRSPGPQAEMFANGQFRKMLINRKQIEKVQTGKLVINPK